MANTSNFTIEKPTVGGYRNTWGGTLNLGIDKIDELLALALPIGTIQIYPLATAPIATGNGGAWIVCNGSAISRTTYSALFALIGETYGVGDGSNSFNVPDMRTRVPVGYSASTVGSGSTQRTPKALAAGTGEENHTLLDAEIPKHLHSITDPGHLHATTESTHIHSGTTNDATTSITDSGHSHSQGSRVTNWQGGSDYAEHQTQIGKSEASLNTGSGSATIVDPGHGHSFDTGGTATGLSIDSNNTGITATQETGVGDGVHNNMQPYLVLNYIILAKHPTF